MYLIDTHALLWEIAIKRNIGKLDLDFSIKQIENLCAEKEISILPITAEHLDALESLPNHHKDPFDRLIVAQAKCENLAIITRDAIIPKYDVKTVW